MTYLKAIAYHLPETIRTNEDLVRLNPNWNGESIFAKTGIRARHVTTEDETALDLGCRAAQRLLEATGFDAGDVDAVLFCTESPDYFLPPSACLLQERLHIPTSCAAFDFNLGCSGFTYGLWLARALIESASAKNVLLVAAETYSKYCSPNDLVTATIFGDAGAAAWVSADPEGALAQIGPSIVGTDGRGARQLIVSAGGARQPKTSATSMLRCDDKGNCRSDEQLYMNGPEIYSFTLSAVQAAIQQLLDRLSLEWTDIDLFLFHQANRFMLEQLRRKMYIPTEKMPIELEDTGNTVSASIPILICRCQERDILKPGQRCVLAGFGVGYSWAMTYLTWGLPPS
jgi:3-oxoacyl-[acyl-carrier-protein] synthase-3